MQEPVPGSLGMELVEVGASAFLIGGSVSENVIGDDQNLVGRGHDRLANAAACFAVEVRGEITIFLVTYRPSRLAQRAPQPAITLAGALTQLLAAALSIAGAHSGPTGSVWGIGKHAHGRPQFRNQSPGCDDIHPWNTTQSVDGRLVRFHASR